MNLFKSVQGSDLALRFIPAALVYVVISIAVIHFAVKPATSMNTAILSGLFIGFCMYGLYDLTNFATLKGWTLEMTVIDMAWGSFVCGSAAAVAYYVKRI